MSTTDAPTPTVAVVILNWNGRKWLEMFLPFLIERSKDAGVSLWVADNASDDDSVAYVEREFKEVQLIRLEENYGFAEGYNRALAPELFPSDAAELLRTWYDMTSYTG